MISVKQLNKTYRSGSVKFQALKDVSLTIPDGEFAAIQGKSGAGKSTLLHILGCLDGFDSGEYRLDGISIGTCRESQRVKLRNEKIGFVLQDFALIPYRSALFNVMLPDYFNRTPRKTMKETALHRLEQVGMADYARKKVNQLSGGQRQRVAIARAIVNTPSLVLADEPTGALDTKTSSQIMELLAKLNEQGITIVVVTHDSAVASCCRRILTLEDGQVLSDTQPDVCKPSDDTSP